jgi:phosphoenolpyruvate carboxylase
MIKRDLYYERIPTKSLREDIKLLGAFLGKVIKDQEGTSFYQLVEKIRLLSKVNKKKIDKIKPNTQLINEINKLIPQKLFKLTRSFTHFLNLMNLAESLDASRKLNEYENKNSKTKNQNIFIEEITKKLFKNKKINNNKIYKQVQNLNIEIVLTAHPTEVKRRTLIQKYANLIKLLEQRQLFRNYPSRIREIDIKLYSEITIIWKTDDLKRSKPKPTDEARWGLAVIEDSLWDTIPKVYKRINSIFKKKLNKDFPINFSPIKFGSWMGGDRDGNPNVTASVTKETILLSRWQAAKLYDKELTKLIQDLSINECSKKILKFTGKNFEPYRVYLRPLRNKIRSTHELIEKHLIKSEKLDEKKLIQSKNEILEPLGIVRDSLNKCKGEKIGNGDLLDLIRRTKCFGINLARIDIRQESSRHTKLVSALISKKLKYNLLNEDKKINLLISLIKKKNCVKNLKLKDLQNKETWATFQLLSTQPKECLGAYVISMTANASDILSIFFLQKEAKIKSPLRVVPLFETLEDLKNAKMVMEKLFSLKWYQKLINRKQEIMIGYSDSSKDAGKLSASWHQYKLQEDILELGIKYKINVSFFHGRGGSAGRGGGPIQATLKSQPPNSVNGQLRITDQGEVIQQKYGYKPLAEYNLCSYIGSVMEASLTPPPKPKNDWRTLIEKMSNISSSAYRKNINDNEDFIRYFKTITPHKSLAKLSIGSRPSKRKNIDNIKGLRAIPWVFAWTQIRLMLPAWLGTPEALRYASIKSFSKTLLDMERNWPFFYSTMDILDMVISKIDPEISKIYENYLADNNLKRVGKRLRFQFQGLKNLHNKITPKDIVKERKKFRKLLFVRNNYTEVLNILQATIMSKSNNRKLNYNDRKYLDDAIMTSIAGLSAAIKNTG